VFLNAAALGDVPIVRQSLDDGALTLNVNCVDTVPLGTVSTLCRSDSQRQLCRHCAARYCVDTVSL